MTENGTAAWVVAIGRNDPELDVYQAFERAAAMVGGPVGDAVLEALAKVHDGVSQRSRVEVA